MTLRKGIPAKSALTDADDTRYDFRNLVVCNSDGTPRGGLTSPFGVNVVTSTATMNVAVGAFNAVAVRDNGAILLANDGPTNVLIGAAPAANSRIDVVYAKQNDASSTVTAPDADNNPILGVAVGTASPTPVKPAIPIGAVELATIQVPSTATATNSAGVIITQTGTYTAAPGGALPFRYFSDMAAWANPMPWQIANVFGDSSTVLNGLYIWQPGDGWNSLGGSSLAWTPITPFNASLWTINAATRVVKVGREVHFHLSVTKNAVITVGELISILPGNLRPSDTVAVPCVVVNGGAEALSILSISPDGGIRPLVTPASNARTYKVDGMYMLN